MIAQMIATVGGIGYLRPAPGTWGSLAALPLTWALHQIGGFPLVLAAVLLITVAGTWATMIVTRGQDNHDPSEVVIDEVAGQMIALAPLSCPAWNMGIDITALWPGWIAAFVLFRLFDTRSLVKANDHPAIFFIVLITLLDSEAPKPSTVDYVDLVLPRKKSVKALNTVEGFPLSQSRS